MAGSNQEYEPESEHEKAANAFIEALIEGDGKSAAQSLRILKQLDGHLLELLADLLEDGPSPPKGFPCRLIFKRRGPGYPYNKDRERAKRFVLATAFEHERAKGGSKKAAMKRLQESIEHHHDSKKKTGKAPSRSTLYKHLSTLKKPAGSKSE